MVDGKAMEIEFEPLLMMVIVSVIDCVEVHVVEKLDFVAL